jgi:hypothetical protein
MYIDGEEHSAIFNQSGRIIAPNYHNNSLNSYDQNFRNKTNLHHDCESKKNDDMPLCKQLNNSQEDTCIRFP